VQTGGKVNIYCRNGNVLEFCLKPIDCYSTLLIVLLAVGVKYIDCYSTLLVVLLAVGVK
jgi:hypothetical protein